MVTCRLYSQEILKETNFLNATRLNQALPEAGIDTGPIYFMRSQSRNSHQFFIYKSWQKSDIVYNNKLYLDLHLVYDINKDQLVLKHPKPDRRDGIALNMDLVTQFVINGHHFMRDANNIFVELIYQGENFHIVASRKKNLITSSTGAEYANQNVYFLWLNKDPDAAVWLKSRSVLKEVFGPSYSSINKLIKSSYKHGFSLTNEQKLIGYLTRFDELLD